MDGVFIQDYLQQREAEDADGTGTPASRRARARLRSRQHTHAAWYRLGGDEKAAPLLCTDDDHSGARVAVRLHHADLDACTAGQVAEYEGCIRCVRAGHPGTRAPCAAANHTRECARRLEMPLACEEVTADRMLETVARIREAHEDRICIVVRAPADGALHRVHPYAQHTPAELCVWWCVLLHSKNVLCRWTVQVRCCSSRGSQRPACS